ncbi:hypothetical protein DFJ77DRAFT_173447 [Powellomyces hirtus]|nr:hypothetical protein DFJ77DRAFT_173447 [Powellomyces hirtus]
MPSNSETCLLTTFFLSLTSFVLVSISFGNYHRNMFSTAGVLGWDDPHTMPNYEVHRGYLRSLWIVPTVLGGLFAITMIGRFMATAMYYGALDVKEQLKSLKPGSRRDSRQEASSSAGEGGGAPGSVAAEIEALPSRASTLYGGEGEERGEEEETKSTLVCTRSILSTRHNDKTLALTVAFPILFQPHS